MENLDNHRINAYTDWIIKWRWLVVVLSVVMTLGAASGVRLLKQGLTYRQFFSPSNPQLLATEALEATYTKGDSQVFVVHNPEGSVFVPSAIRAIHELTEAGWQTPYSTRVDSLTNYQHSWAENDDLMVEKLIPEDIELDESVLERARQVAMSEPLMAGNIVTLDEDTTMIIIRVEIPPEDLEAVPLLAEDSRRVLSEIQEAYPDLHFELTGTGLLQAAFNEATVVDGKVIYPSMFVLLLLFLAAFTRSVSGTLVTLCIIGMSAAAGAGAMGYYGFPLNPVLVIAPVIILTLAVADSVHVLSGIIHEMRNGTEKITAIRRSIAFNLTPVFLTSLTTAVGFLVMNFSDSPPFKHLGNVTATGVGVAWLLSMTFLPAVISMVPIRVKQSNTWIEHFFIGLSDFVISKPRFVAAGMSLVFVILIASTSRIEVNDFPHRYFNEKKDFRRGTDFLENQRGFFDFSMSVPSTGSGGINDPEYLRELERFETWLQTQPFVVHVSSYSKVIKKLNKNMHGDEAEYYRVPENRELAAQYLLLYEMSLPFGLDLNDMIDVDKSATKVTVLFQNAGLSDIKRVGVDAEAWLNANSSHAAGSPASSYAVMFAYITEANAVSMVWGTLIAFLLIAGILILSLRSWAMGIASLVSNMLPVAAAIGIWALTVVEANFAVSILASLSIGIVVDDTVHILTKYSFARRTMGRNAEEAVRYAFTHVGRAVLSTSLILVGGFSVLMLSSFWATIVIGALTSLTILCALAADFLLLPALLIVFDRRV
jgi:hypothetical protein